MWTDRTKILLGQAGLEKLSKCHVAVIGIGGVGGYVCLLLARAGIGNLTLVDFDVIDETNINRQVVANVKTLGKKKTEIMKEMILDINPKCKITVHDSRFDKTSCDKIFSKYFDFVVDAIDSVEDKVELISYCKTNDIEIISAMGAGNRAEIPDFKVMDIYKTSNDGLAKIMRKKLREREIKSLDVVTSLQVAQKNLDSRDIGSISYQPAMCGCVIAGFVVNKLID